MTAEQKRTVFDALTTTVAIVTIGIILKLAIDAGFDGTVVMTGIISIAGLGGYAASRRSPNPPPPPASA